MIRNLKEFRNYMPQSLLMDEDAEDEESEPKHVKKGQSTVAGSERPMGSPRGRAWGFPDEMFL